MKKKSNIILWCLCYLGLSCNSQNPTPDKYKYPNSITNAQYQKNQAELKDSIENLIKKKEGPYYPNENDSSTKIIIDTILYSPNNDKYASFIITENSNDKLLSGGSKDEHHYNAYSFIGKLNRETSIQDLTWISAYSFDRYKTLGEVSFLIREVYFKEITVGNHDEKSIFKYNFDDIRFWNGPIWDKYYN